MSEWKRVGEVGVDAGLVWIGDPCYFFGNKIAAEHKPELDTSDWIKFISTINDKKPVRQYNYRLGHPGLGVLTDTGYGDGTYDVMAKFTKNGRVAEIKVVFIDSED